MKEYPLHKKLKANAVAAFSLSQFLDFLDEKELTIAETYGGQGRLYPITKTKEQLIGEFLGIDPKALQAEKEEIIEELRNLNK